MNRLLLSVLLVLMGAAASGQQPAAPTAPGAAPPAPRFKMVVPPGYEQVKGEGFTAVCLARDVGWVKQAVAGVKPATRPTTMPADVLKHVTENRAAVVKQMVADFALADDKQPNAFFDDGLIPTLKKLDALRPSSPYSAAKAAGELLMPAYVRTFGVDASITRGANTYGSHQYPEKLIPLFTTNALDGEPLPVYGDGRQRREWLHVADHCSGIDLVLLEGKPGEIYNIGGQERENMDVVRRILDLTGGSPDLVRMVDDRPGHDRRYSIDATKLHGLGWTPQHSFESGLAETVEWYRTHREWWEPIKSGEFREYYERQYAARLS
jgi:hypothetical protein